MFRRKKVRQTEFEMNEEYVLNMFLIAVLNGLYLVLFLIILYKFYLCMHLSISDYIVSNGRVNPENDLEIMSKERIKKTRPQYFLGGNRENGDH
jgi:hypothetical protein